MVLCKDATQDACQSWLGCMQLADGTQLACCFADIWGEALSELGAYAQVSYPVASKREIVQVLCSELLKLLNKVHIHHSPLHRLVKSDVMFQIRGGIYQVAEERGNSS